MDGEQELVHLHSAEPLDTRHLACGGQALRAQGVAGLSGRKKDSTNRLRTEKEEIGTAGKKQLIYVRLPVGAFITIGKPTKKI